MGQVGSFLFFQGSTAWEIPWTEEPVGLSSMESQELDTT